MPYTWLTPQRPNHEPPDSWQSISHRIAICAPGVSRSPSSASISRACAVTSALGSSITSPKSRNGSSRTSARVFSASNAPQPPPELCIPSTHRAARRIAPSVAALEATRRSASTTSAVSSTSG